MHLTSLFIIRRSSYNLSLCVFQNTVMLKLVYNINTTQTLNNGESSRMRDHHCLFTMTSLKYWAKKATESLCSCSCLVYEKGWNNNHLFRCWANPTILLSSLICLSLEAEDTDFWYSSELWMRQGYGTAIAVDVPKAVRLQFSLNWGVGGSRSLLCTGSLWLTSCIERCSWWAWSITMQSPAGWWSSSVNSWCWGEGELNYIARVHKGRGDF